MCACSAVHGNNTSVSQLAFFFFEDQPLSLIRKLAVKLTVVVANEQ